MKLELLKTDSDVERVCKEVMEEYEDDFSFLQENSIFQFTSREKPEYDEDGQEVAASARKLSNRERDLYGSDFEICVYEPYWETLTEMQKHRLIYHELLHCYVAEDEDNPSYPAYDSDNRVVIGIVPHDLIVKTFKAEIEQFGLSGTDLQVAEFFYNQYKEYLEAHEKKSDAKPKRHRHKR